jgi:hypothetical protein
MQEASLTRATPDDLALMTQVLSDLNELDLQVFQVSAIDISQLDTLEILSDAPIRIEISSVGGELLQMQVFADQCFEKCPDILTAVNRDLIPYYDDLAAHLSSRTPRKLTSAAPLYDEECTYKNNLPE